MSGATLTLERTLTASGAGIERTISRFTGSFEEEGFEVGDRVSIATGGIGFEAEVASVGVSDLGITLDDTLPLPVLPDDFIATIRRENRVALTYDAAANTFTYDFRYSGERTSQFNVDLGQLAAENGVKFASDVNVDLEASFESTLSLVIDLDENGAGVDPEDSTPSSATLVGLDASVNVNTPEAPIADLPTNGANSDLARAIFDRNIAQGKSSDIGFLGAQVSDRDAATTMDGFIALRAALSGSGTSADDYVSESYLALDIPIAVKSGLLGFVDNEDLRISSLNAAGADPQLVFEIGSVFEGGDALADSRLFQGFEGDVEKFANIDAPGFIRQLGEIRAGLQRVNDSELLSNFDIPLITPGLAALTNLADAFGDAVLYDDGDDGVDRNNDDALVTDLNKKLVGTDLEGLVEFRVVEGEFGAAETAGRTFALIAIDRSVTRLSVDLADGVTSFFGITETTTNTRDSETGVLQLKGTLAFDPELGRLRAAQAATILVERSVGDPVQLGVALTEADTDDNEIVGNDTPKLLDADNAPTFSTAQELSQKLIELALDAIDLEGLSYATTDSNGNPISELRFAIDLEQRLFTQEFDVEFDLDLDPVGSIRTTGRPKILVSGDVGFSIQFGIDLSDTPNGVAGIDVDTDLTELRGIDEIGDLIKLGQAITARGDGSVSEVNEPDTPEEERVQIELDRVRMAAGTVLDFGSVDYVAPAVERLVGDKVQIVAPDGYNVRIFQSVAGTDRLTDDSLQQQSLILPRAVVTSDPLVYENEIDEALTFWVAVYDANGGGADVVNGMPDPADPDWVEVTVAAPATPIDVSTRSGKTEYIGLIRSAIRNAQNAEISNTITRVGAGSWITEGFGVGQRIQISNAGSNSGTFEVTAATASTLTVREDLTAATGVRNAQVEGAGKITAVGEAEAFDELSAGERIQIVGSLRNDGTYLVAAKTADGALVLADDLDPEAASSDISIAQEGNTVRLDRPVIEPDATETEVTAAEEAAAAKLNIELGGTLYGIVIYAAATESDPFAPHTADNRSPNDLLQDLRVALGRATTGGFDTDGEVVDLLDVERTDGVAASLDGTRLVITRTGENESVVFRVVDANANAQRLGFEPVQDSNLADLLVVLGNGDEAAISLDGLTTVGQVLTAIEAAFPAPTGTDQGPLEGSRVRARISANGTGIEIVERGQLSGRPRLTVAEVEGSQEREFTRSAGSWSDDGFRVAATPQTFEFEGTTYTVTAVDEEADTLTATAVDSATASSERFVNGAVIAIDGVPLGSGDLEVELINGSVAAAGLGILRSDAAADENEDGRIDAADRDGLLEGDAIGGASIFDRIFLRDPEFTVGLEIAPVDARIDVEARIGFVEADLAATGGFGANGVFGLNDLPPVDSPDTAPDGKITLREFARGLRIPRTFIDTPRFEAGTLDDQFSGSLIARNETLDGVQRGILERSVQQWDEDDGFRAGQKVTIRGFVSGSVAEAELPNGTYTILEIREVGEGTSRLSQLVLERAFELGSNPSLTHTGSSLPEVIGSFGVFRLALESIAADGFGSIQLDELVDDEQNARVELTLFDFGDPFFRESMGVATTATPEDPDGPGGSVVATGLDTLSITRDVGNPQSDEIDSALRDVRGALDADDEVRVEIVYLDKDGDEQTETRKVEGITAPPPPGPGEVATALTFPVTLTLAEDLVDDLADIREEGGSRVIQKITFTKPPKTDVQTPNLGSLLDFENFDIRDFIRGLQMAADFLGQFEQFDFLDEPIPIVELSFNDLLDYADQLAAAVEEIQGDPDGTLQSIERRLEEILGITPDDPFDIDLSLVSEELAARLVDGVEVEATSRKVLKIDLVLGDGFAESVGIDIELGGGVLAGSAGLDARASGSIEVSLGIDISDTTLRGAPDLSFSVASDDQGRIQGRVVRSDQTPDGDVSWLDDGFLVGQIIKIKGSDGRDGRYEILAIEDAGPGSTMLLERTDSAPIAWTPSSEPLPGVEVTGSRSVSLFDSTAISAAFEARASEVDFRGAVGPLGIFVQDGTAFVEGGVGSGAERDIFVAGLEFDAFSAALGTNQDGQTRRLIAARAFDNFAAVFDVDIAFDSGFDLPIYFPTDSLLQGRVELTGSVSINDLSISQLRGEEAIDFDSSLEVAYYRGGAAVDFDDLFGLDQFDPADLSLFDNIRLAVDGFDLLLGGIQDVLDGEILGIDLPLIGDSLADGARFIEDLRDDFVEPFRDGIDDAETFVDDLNDPNRNVISRLLFDLLEQTGLLLVTHDRDGNALSDDQVFTARASGLTTDYELATDLGDYATVDVASRAFLLSQVVALNGTRRDSEGNYFDPRIEPGDDPEAPGSGDSQGEIDVLGIPTGQIRDLAFLEWDFRLGQQLAAVDTDIALDFGIPAIGLEADGALGIELGWDLELGFGLDFESGFYFDISSQDELEINVDVVLPDSLTGRLAFLQLEAENAGSGLGATFVVDLVNKDDTPDLRDERLSFTELGKLRLDAGIAAEATADLELELKLNDELLANFANVFPTVLADFEFEWALGDRDAGVYVSISDLSGSALSEGLEVVQFTDVNLDLGSFVSDFIKPVLGEIQKVTGPIQPIVDILTAPLPVVSDLGPPVTLLDLARLSGKPQLALIESIADIITLVNSIPTNIDTVMIPFGDFVIYRKATGSEPQIGVDPTSRNADLSGLSQEQGSNREPGRPASTNQTTNFVDKLKSTRGFKFPILDDPTQIFGLLTGEEVVLFGYDMPPLELDLSYTAFFPVFGPLGVGLTGTAGARIDFAFGFDSSGLERFFDSGFTNPGLIFDGFFVSDNPQDVTGSGPDGNELEFDLGFYLSAELNLGLARAGVAGGIAAGVDFDLFDPDRDGKIRVGEILENIENEFLFGSPVLAPLAIFDVSGEVTARAFAFLEVNLLFFDIYKEFSITPTLKLADFEVEFTRAPKLATVLEDGTLQLNMGDFAGERLNGDLRDGDEHFRVESLGSDIRVTWVGSNPGGRAFFNDFDASEITGVLAVAGAGNDVVDVSRVTRPRMRYEIDGGAGNDRILGGVIDSETLAGEDAPTGIFRGGDGSDEIVGTAGRDLIVGGAGDDRIFGGGGDDVVFGDIEQLIEKQPRVRNAEISFIGDGADYASATLTNLDEEADFEVGGFAEGQTVVVNQLRDGADGVPALVFEGLYRISTGGVSPSSLVLQSTIGGERSFALPSVQPGDRFEIAAQDAVFLAAYKSTATDSDGSDVIVGGFGSDWILGAGGDDVLIGGGDAGDSLVDGLPAAAPNVTRTAVDERFLVLRAYLVEEADGRDDRRGCRGRRQHRGREWRRSDPGRRWRAPPQARRDASRSRCHGSRARLRRRSDLREPGRGYAVRRARRRRHSRGRRPRHDLRGDGSRSPLRRPGSRYGLGRSWRRCDPRRRGRRHALRRAGQRHDLRRGWRRRDLRAVRIGSSLRRLRRRDAGCHRLGWRSALRRERSRRPARRRRGRRARGRGRGRPGLRRARKRPDPGSRRLGLRGRRRRIRRLHHLDQGRRELGAGHRRGHGHARRPAGRRRAAGRWHGWGRPVPAAGGDRPERLRVRRLDQSGWESRARGLFGRRGTDRERWRGGRRLRARRRTRDGDAERRRRRRLLPGRTALPQSANGRRGQHRFGRSVHDHGSHARLRLERHQ